jgi:predicted RNA binding protein YcfA (HicA-like mRNA interferase family)
MKYSELIKLLKKNNCKFFKSGTRHDIWISNNTGKTFTVPRHKGQEVPDGTLNNIMKDAGLK